MSTLLRRALVLFAAIAWLPAFAQDTLTLGVLAFRPRALILERYAPLADYLSRRLGGVRVELAVLSQEELDEAVDARRIDLLMTNPSHYLELRSHNSLSGALATVISVQNGQAVTGLGGVIIVAAGRTDIGDLAALAGRRVAIPGLRFLGGYQTQVYELRQAGLKVPDDIDLLITGNHEGVIEAVLEGRADAGFIRTGIIESLVAEGRLDPARLVVLNRQHLAGYPFAVLTRLYPEWPFIALPHVDARTVRRISAALLALEPSDPAPRAAGLAGFSPPLDYLPVENLARALRLPPFDHAPSFVWRDVWGRYAQFIVALGVLSVFAMGLLVVLMRRNRQLARSVAALEDAQEALRHIAYHDALTGLPNRVLLIDRLFQDMGRVRRSGQLLALGFIDLDGFKAVNDSHGHEMGDRLLVEIAHRMRGVLREADTVARLGGDEFAAIFTDLPDAAVSEALIDRLLAAIAAPVRVDGVSLHVSASVGVAYFRPGNEIEPEQLLRRADHAMYLAKQSGRNCCRVFDEDAMRVSDGAGALAGNTT